MCWVVCGGAGGRWARADAVLGGGGGGRGGDGGGIFNYLNN